MALKQRLITGIVAATGFLLLLYLGGIFYMAIILVMSVIGYLEFARLNRFNIVSLSTVIGVLSTIISVIPWTLIGTEVKVTLDQTIWLTMLGFMTVTVLSRNKINLQQIAVLLLGAIYIGIGFHAMLSIRLDESQFGLIWAIFVFACIWATDSGAYLIGRMYGKHLLWPSISPNKTVEGAVGGIIFSVVVALIFSLLFNELPNWTTMTGLGILIACFGQLGDFIQSGYKRVAKIKDTGNILPGHGGILDRCDSWLIVFPMIYILLGG